MREAEVLTRRAGNKPALTVELVDGAVIARLRKAAAARDMTTERLARDLIEAAVTDDLVGAILGDR